ncbi:1-acyl-sn-glycerol-3-phosphate acyltransferase [Planctomicrobium sp.]|jgi:1-acyl-sn-glycerol-3-phosphate acyltransferase|nr:lysophospholipid acyltransferase family protein [Planctomicrobium sp.]MBT5018089.1 1-acyl-sn-glycerol-3-phosphate acyltransferase [Planctomicrobium sp.]MDB4743397.1 1-acyl-sn-glycerol-3-phosphate acyltransferase [Planctomicrobium sp.]
MSNSEDLPNPQSRNCVWRLIQIQCYVVFKLWFRFQAKGYKNLPQGGAMLLSNHQSFLDPLLIGVLLKRPVSFLARDSLFRIPVVGWILKHTYVMPISRKSAGTESMKKSIARLDHGFYVGLFPEGTRTEDGSVGKVKPGFIAMIRRSEVPIVPVGIAGAYEAMPRKSNFVRPVKIRLVYGEPISLEEISELSKKGNEKQFAELVQQRIIDCQKQADEWRTGLKVNG